MLKRQLMIVGLAAVLSALLLAYERMARHLPNAAAAQETQPAIPPDRLLLKDYRPKSIYNIPQTRITKARFPVIDVHSHPYANTPEQIEQWVRAMDEVGIEKSIILVSSAGKSFDAALARFAKYPERFELWCGIDTQGSDQPDYAQRSVAELVRCYNAGAKGVGELVDKGEGFNARDGSGRNPLHIDDPRLDAVLEKCGELHLPVNIHVGEDRWMYEPMDKSNDGLMNAFTWRVAQRPGVLGHDEVVATLDRALARHPRTTFIACHFANCCSDLSVLARMLDDHSNLYADIGARFGETAPIPRYMKKFYEKYRDRLLYGTDMGRSASMYRETFRILESEDEHFYGTDFFSYHWPLNGFGLSDEVLRKVYGGNARRILPSYANTQPPVRVGGDAKNP